MKSYKNWKLVNESLFPLGLSQPQTVGGLVGNTPIAEAKKKIKGNDAEMDDNGDSEEHTCSCNKNMKKKMKGEEGMKNSKQTPKDHSNEKSWSKEGGKKKKMGDEMEAPMLKKKKPVDDIEDDEDDVEDDHIEDDEDDMGDEEGVDGSEDHDEDDDMGNDDMGDDEEGDSEDMKKYGFMKKKMKKMKKKMKKMQEEAAQFEKNISEYPDMPQDHSQELKPLLNL